MRLRFTTAVTAAAVTVLILASVSAAHADGPDQVDRGREIFAQRCSTCHGDMGQGLTDEFRATWPPEDQNCWNSKCHSVNHPPDGFVLPRTVPAIIGPGTLTHFDTALQLHNFASQAMPYQAPGSLTGEEYWDVTAFLLASHAVQFEGELSDETAPSIRLRPDQLPPGGVWVGLAAMAGSAVLVGVWMWWRRWRSARVWPRG